MPTCDESAPPCLAAGRHDSSFYRCPSGGRRYHVSKDGVHPACSRKRFLDDVITAEEVPAVLRCQRSGCRQLWLKEVIVAAKKKKVVKEKKPIRVYWSKTGSWYVDIPRSGIYPYRRKADAVQNGKRAAKIEGRELVVEDKPIPPEKNNGWTSVKDKLPKCSKKRDSFGVAVLVWPYREPFTHLSSPGPKKVERAFYGRRITNEPNFYLHGAIVHGVTHWQSMPEKPKR